MRTTLDPASDVLPSGTITFSSSFLPPLQAGPYVLSATQSPTLPPEWTSPEPYTASQAFTVDGPRFGLRANDVQSTWPPSNTQGAFAMTLPHVVLNARTLPWARAVGGGAPAPTPWVALLVFHPTAESANYSGPTQGTVNDLVNPPSGTVGPDLTGLTSTDLASAAIYLDIDATLFTGIAPQVGELPLLCHGRDVDTSAKATSGGVQAGTYAVAVANRLPDSDPSESRPTAVYLVSMEGQVAHLPGAASPPTSGKVRVCVLAGWSFTTGPFAGDFLALMQALPSRGGVSLLRMPYTPGSTADPNAAYAQEALDLGYVPLEHLLRTGETTTSWIRGPLVPFPTVENTGPWPVSDSALRYDPVAGLFDTTVAAAWQAGRMLALSDRSFTASMIAWKRSVAADGATAAVDASTSAQLGREATGSTRKERHRSLVRGVALEAGRAAALVPGRVRRSERSADVGWPGIAPESAPDPLSAVIDHLAPVLRREP